MTTNHNILHLVRSLDFMMFIILYRIIITCPYWLIFYRTTSVNDVAESADVKSVCKVCGSKEIQVSLRNKNEYCKVCFLPILTHKFKATLGKSKVVRSTDSVLIAHSGKVNSTVLVHLIKANVNEPSCKKIPFQCKVLYIDGKLIFLIFEFYFKYL